jgi:hypothetical protein
MAHNSGHISLLKFLLKNTIKKVKRWLGMVVHTCNASTWEGEAGELCIQGQPGLHSKFQTSLGYTVRYCLKKANQKRKEGRNRE